MKAVTHNGKTYRSMAALHRECAAKTVTYQHLMNRLRVGWELGEALTTPGETNAVIYNGRTYRSLKALYRSLRPQSVALQTFTTRVAVRGWTIAKALSTPTAHAHTRQFEVDGVLYKSLGELARAAGITYMAAVRRCYRGFTDSEVFHGRPKRPVNPTSATQDRRPKRVTKDRRRKPVTIAGVHYDSMVAAHRALKPKADLTAIKARLRYDWTLEQAFETEPKADGRALAAKYVVAIDGATLSIATAARIYGVPSRTIRARLGRGATGKQAVGLEPMTLRNTTKPKCQKAPKANPQSLSMYVVDGVAYESMASLAKAFGLPYSLVRARIKDFRWDVKRSVTQPQSKSVSINGQTYRSAASAWKAIGQTQRHTFDRRLRLGYSLECCLGFTPIPPRHTWTVEGKEYNSLREVATAYGLSLGVLQQRLTFLDLSEAVNYRHRNVGRYTLQRCRQNKSLARSSATVYFVRVTTADGDLHKIGITTQSLAGRLHSNRFEVLSTYWGSLASVLRIEGALLRLFSANLYAAPRSFAGRTETFLLLPAEEASMLEQMGRFAAKHGCAPGTHLKKRRG
jgi:hypothetical protein